MKAAKTFKNLWKKERHGFNQGMDEVFAGFSREMSCYGMELRKRPRSPKKGKLRENHNRVILVFE